MANTEISAEEMIKQLCRETGMSKAEAIARVASIPSTATTLDDEKDLPETSKDSE